jgi:hypothetical protein
MMFVLNIIFFAMSAFAGLSIKADLSSYIVYSYDSSRIILQSVDKKQKWVMSRQSWFAGQEPTIGKKIFLAGSIKKQLVPHR